MRRTMIASTPDTPYYAVIFTSIRTDIDNGYADMALRMIELATHQDEFPGFESAVESMYENIGEELFIK